MSGVGDASTDRPATSPITLSAGNPMRTVLLAVLGFEVIVFGLGIPVMIYISHVSGGLAGGFGGAASLLALVAAATLRRPGGYALGWLTQLFGLALGLLTPTMFIAGGIFAAIWIMTFVLGKKLDAR